MKVSAVCVLFFAASAQYALAQSSEEQPTAASATAIGVETGAPEADIPLPTAEPKTNAEIDSCINNQLAALKCKAGDFGCFCFSGGLSEEKVAEDPKVLECVEKLNPDDQITLLQSMQWGCMEVYKERGVTITDVNQIVSEFPSGTAAADSADATATGTESADASATDSATDDDSDATGTDDATATESEAVDRTATDTEAAASATESNSASGFQPANVFAVAVGGIASLIFLL